MSNNTVTGPRLLALPTELLLHIFESQRDIRCASYLAATCSTLWNFFKQIEHSFCYRLMINTVPTHLHPFVFAVAVLQMPLDVVQLPGLEEFAGRPPPETGYVVDLPVRHYIRRNIVGGKLRQFLTSISTDQAECQASFPKERLSCQIAHVSLSILPALENEDEKCASQHRAGLPTRKHMPVWEWSRCGRCIARILYDYYHFFTSGAPSTTPLRTGTRKRSLPEDDYFDLTWLLRWTCTQNAFEAIVDACRFETRQEDICDT